MSETKCYWPAGDCANSELIKQRDDMLALLKDVEPYVRSFADRPNGIKVLARLRALLAKHKG